MRLLASLLKKVEFSNCEEVDGFNEKSEFFKKPEIRMIFYRMGGFHSNIHANMVFSPALLIPDD